MDGWVRMAWPMANLADPGSPGLLITSDIRFHNDTPCMLIKIQTILFRQKALRIWCCGTAATNTPLGRTEGFSAVFVLVCLSPLIIRWQIALSFAKPALRVDMKVGSGGARQRTGHEDPLARIRLLLYVLLYCLLGTLTRSCR